MEGLKIVIGKNKDTANQAKDLLLKLGLYVSSEKRHNFYGWVARVGSGEYLNDISAFNKNKAKLVTIQDLKDLVVLKRNDVGDANFENEVTGIKYFISSAGEIYFWGGNWEKCHPSIRIESLKPIKEGVKKEYLVKTDSGNYLYTKNVSDISAERVIEIPDGAEKYIQGVKYPTRFGFVKGDKFWDGEWVDHVDLEHEYNVVWQREKESTMQEKLDYADELRDMGESGWSKEKHSHYKKDVSHLKMIDPYRISDLYDLHSCADHIMKKSLCAGNRGHKDTLRDIQDIIDTAERWKQMIEEDNNEI